MIPQRVDQLGALPNEALVGSEGHGACLMLRRDIPLHAVFHGVMPFILVDVGVVALLTIYPQIVTLILKAAH